MTDPSKIATVVRSTGGWVDVGGRRLAKGHRLSVVNRVRERLPDDFWRNAALATESDGDPGFNPLTSGIDFYLDGQYAQGLFDHEWIADVAEEAFEAAREIIVTAIDRRAGLLRVTLSALFPAPPAPSVPSTDRTEGP